METKEIVSSVFSEYGVVGLLFISTVIGLVKIYMLERADRINAWTAYNKLAHETNEVLKDIHLVMEGIKERVR